MLVYRRREQADAGRQYRAKMRALAPFFEETRKKAELVQRLMWKGPAASFVFNEAALVLPPRPRRFRALPTAREMDELLERVLEEHYADLAAVTRASQKAALEAEVAAQAAAAAASKKKKGKKSKK